VLRLALPDPGDRAFRLLCLGAHPDDLEIGAAGTIRRLLAEHPATQVRWAVMSGSEARAAEARASAMALVGAERIGLTQATFRDGYLPFEGAAVKDRLAEVRDGFDPDLVLTHRTDDLHQDHRLIGELTHQLFRDHLVWAYEIAKTDGDLATPNLYVPLDRETVDVKVDHLVRHFPSQAARPWFDPNAFRALMRIRGLEASAASGYAEGFHVRRVIV
jgi:LmbE family N-acetylglucosaminyl deacetylase